MLLPCVYTHAHLPCHIYAWAPRSALAQHTIMLRALLLLSSVFYPTSTNSGAWEAEECRTVGVDGSLSLQQAVERLSTADDGNATNCSIVEIPAGEHVLSSQTLFPGQLESLEIRGPWDDTVSVVCRYEAETNYTWYFSEMEALQIRNVHFHGCPRPLRIDTVADVELTNCSFRYITHSSCLHCPRELCHTLLGLCTMCCLGTCFLAFARIVVHVYIHI